MRATRITVILCLSGALAACANPDPGAGVRTVFHNPYAATQIDRTGIGPQCDVDLGRDATCLGAVVATRGRTAILANGAETRLTKAQARLLRERREQLEAARSSPPTPPSTPPLPSLPPADRDAP